MGLGDLIEVNGFVFCRDHGTEYCGWCTCDYRDINNCRVENDPAVIRLNEEAMAFSILNRQPINVYEKGATPRRADRYECITHRVVDCKDCFNWVKFICDEAREVERTEAWLRRRERWLNRADP